MGWEGYKLAGFLMPYFDLDKNMLNDFYRFRVVQDKPTRGWGSVAEAPKKPLRYLQPPNTGCQVYVPPLLNWQIVIKDPSMPIVITEGEKKAASGCAHGITTLGLGGVSNWQSKSQLIFFLPMLEKFTWAGRLTILCFDSDMKNNEEVLKAALALSRELSERGAIVRSARLPSTKDGIKQGMDDIIAGEGGVTQLRQLLQEADAIGASHYLHEMNTQVAFVQNTGEIVDLNTGVVMHHRKFAEAHYSNHVYKDLVNGKVTLRKTADDWLCWPHRRTVRGFDYLPGAELITAQDDYNSWAAPGNGWAVEPSNKGDIAMWEELLYKLMSGEKAAVQLWVKRWFGYPIKYPGTKLFNALLFQGRGQGTGKSLLGNTMASIYGRNFGTVTTAQLHSSYTDWAINKQFLMADEVALGEDKRQIAALIKFLITQTELIRVEAKYRVQYSARILANLYFTSNEDVPFRINTDDRRLFVCRVTNDALPVGWGSKFVHWLKQGGAARLMYEFLHMDYGNFDPHGRPPVTEAKQELQSVSLSDCEDWCRQLAANPASVLKPQVVDLYTCDELKAEYDPEGRNSSLKAQMFGMALRSAGVARITRQGSNNVVVGGMRKHIYAVSNAQKYQKMSIVELAQVYDQQHNKKFAHPKFKLEKSNVDK